MGTQSDGIAEQRVRVRQCSDKPTEIVATRSSEVRKPKVNEQGLD